MVTMENKGAVKEAVNLLKEKRDLGLKTKAYLRRWMILFVFSYYASVNSIQWIEYSSITHIVVKYYNVSTLAVNWTSIVYCAVYPFLVIPASYVIDKKGLRMAGLIGCIGTLIGTGIKVLSIRNDLFWVVLLGQTIVSASQLVIICLPPKIASVWFKPNEVSTACSLGVFGTQMGCAIGYVLPPMVVRDSDNIDEIGYGLKVLCWILTASMIPVTLAVLCYFPDEPPLPPSNAQASLREVKKEFESSEFFKSVKKLFLNRGFVTHMIAYSINVGVFSAVGTLLNQFILQHFENANEDAGIMGFVMVIAGMIGSVLFGIILDKTHKYKEINLLIYLLSALSILSLMFSLEYRSKVMTYIGCIIVGTFTNAYMPVGFELAMELTYPSEESTTTGILMAGTQILGVVFTVALGYFNMWMGCFWALATQSAFLFLGTVVTALVPNTLLRQEAYKLNNVGFDRKASYHGSRLVFIE
ncbi:unnamed protein product [Phaedon cochleariae]|uniref:Major facilitator superfamily (MFS) profile domain-containing protein n=1 Tax=Phaedon cochleariae TaxID=80249 RepID=A0A9P0DWJ4_PHACE|nr:unnamed protein product [Phaedon cochleariae]